MENKPTLIPKKHKKKRIINIPTLHNTYSDVVTVFTSITGIFSICSYKFEIKWFFELVYSIQSINSIRRIH
jgi:hypothetical protein